MGFLDNSSITIDAVLTRKGRELLARGENEFKITKFALSDDEVDYGLWEDTPDSAGNIGQGDVISNQPLTEPTFNGGEMMKYLLYKNKEVE